MTARSRLGALARPTSDELVDVAFSLALCVLAIYGFRSTFSGNEELVIGVPAVVLGVALGYAYGKLAVPLLVVVASSAVAFFVFAGPIALRHRAGAGFLPSPSAVSAAADSAVTGWKLLLTTLPPAGEAGDLLTVPYLCGLFAGITTTTLALRYARRSWCGVAPIALLAVSVLMGTKQPVSLLLQGALFATVLLAWLSIRHRRGRELGEARVPRRRIAESVVLLTVAAVFGGIVGPSLPGADANDRYVWRDDVVPPFDPLNEPSALAGFRTYTDEDVREDEILTVDGLPPDQRVRIAMMDDYDDLVWRGSGSGTVLAGEYVRVGAELPTELDTDPVDIEIEVHKPQGVWLPLAGDVRNLTFEGSEEQRLADEVRVSIESDTAAIPSEVPTGVTYRISTRFDELPDTEALTELPLDGRFARLDPDTELPAELLSLASEWAGSAQTPFAEMEAIADKLRTEGRYTDGGVDAQPVSPPGHSLARMVFFLEPANPFGNGEQFGSALALMARARGIPARLVLGFVNRTEDDTVTFAGSDIEAWIEIPVEDVGWVPIEGTPPEDQVPEVVAQPRSVQENPEPQPPPPVTVTPPTVLPEELEAEEDVDEEDEGAGSGWVALLVALAVIGVPGVLVGGPALAIMALKRRRRARRRTDGSPSQRLSASFDELIDVARDLGRPIPPRSTRSERSAVLDSDVSSDLARGADEAVFGRNEPDSDQIDEAWQRMEVGRAELRDGLGRVGHARAAVSLTSLRKG